MTNLDKEVREITKFYVDALHQELIKSEKTGRVIATPYVSDKL